MPHRSPHRPALLASATAIAAALGALVLPAAATAVPTATFSVNTVTLTFDDIAENIVISNDSGGFITWGVAGAPLSADVNTTTGGEQKFLAQNATIVVNAGGGDDRLRLTTYLPKLVVHGGAGNDDLEGSSQADTFDGGPGDDRIVPGIGGDTVDGGDGDDLIVWNEGDGTDTVLGGPGTDTLEVHGSGASETYTHTRPAVLDRLWRTAPSAFIVNFSTERLALNLRAGDDQFTAAAGFGTAVRVDGGDGNDALTTADGADLVLGGPGDDVLAGGLGADLLDGGDGNDTLLALDGQPDLVRCGAGTDTYDLDQLEIDAATADCEGGTRVPTPPVVVPQPPAPLVPGTLDLVGGKLTATKQRVKLTGACPVAATAGCKGTLELVTAKRLTVGKAKGTVVLASAPFNVAPGASAAIEVKLPASWTTLAKAAKPLAADALVRDTGATSDRTALSISEPKKKAKATKTRSSARPR